MLAERSEITSKTRLRLTFSTRQAVAILFSSYILAWGGLLFSANAVYWDGWVLVSGDSTSIMDLTDQLGFPPFGLLHVVLQGIGPVSYRVLSFLSYFIAGLSFFGVLRAHKMISINQATFAACLFLIIPLNAARHTMATMPYAISLAAFYVAWFLIVRNKVPTMRTIIASSALFFFSFATQSLLVFVALPIFHLFLIQRQNVGTTLIKFIGRYWFLFALPPVFYVMKSIIWKPSGLFEGYNELSFRSLVYGGFFLAIATVLLLLTYLRYRTRPSGLSLSLQILSLGIFAWALGAFPYFAIGRTGVPLEWSTRDTLLWPLGLSLIFLALVRLASSLAGRRIAIVSGAALAVLGIVMSMSITFSYWLDWQKQNRIMELLAADDNVRASSLVVFKDDLITTNIFASPYRFYAWTGVMSRAFSDNTRFGINESEISRFTSGQYDNFFGPGTLYGAEDYVATDNMTEVEIFGIAGNESRSTGLSKVYRAMRGYLGLPPLPSEVVDTGQIELRSTLIPPSDWGKK
jgi:hypothetical protein